MAGKLTGKVAMITGASAGIGRDGVIQSAKGHRLTEGDDHRSGERHAHGTVGWGGS